MASEAIYKLEPHRTLQLQGFDGYGATATLHSASASGCTVTGTWGAQDDFAILQLWEINNQFEHPRMRYLPTGDFSGISLSFQIELTNCIGLDSTWFPSIDWPYLDIWVGSPTGPQYATLHKVKLLSYATAVGAYTPATCQFQLQGTITVGDYITLAWLDQQFSYQCVSGDTLTSAAAALAGAITGGSSTGYVSATAGGSTITLTYLGAPGSNGNRIGVYGTVHGATESWNPVATLFQGGVSPTAWIVALNFAGSILDIDGATVPTTNIQRMSLTFAADMQAANFQRSEWSAAFTAWTVTDATGCSHLQVAGPGSVRIEESSTWVLRTGYWEAAPADGFAFWSRGLAIRAAASGAALTIETHCQSAHTIYLGTYLDTDCGIVSVSVDGGTAVEVDCYGSALLARIPVATAAAGQHSVVVTLTGTKNAGSSGWYFYFDFLECAVASDVPDAPIVNTSVGLACDFDTDNAYMLSPERLVWDITRMGLVGEIDHYMGVFWWPVRLALEPVGTWAQAITIGFSGAPFFGVGGYTALTLGTDVLTHWNLIGDTAESIAMCFELWVNAGSTIFWAQASGATLTITGRASSPDYYVAATIATNSTEFAATIAIVNPTAPAIAASWDWGIDDTVTSPVNNAVTAWHADYFAQLHAAGLTCVVAFSQELVNPPAGWAQLYHDGTPAVTATGFGTLNSTMCNFSAGMQAYMTAAYLQMAGLMAAAGLAPRLQFGEVLWWYEVGGSPASTAFYDADTVAAAVVALGRALAVFSTVNDSPAVNTYADANFLRARLGSYVAAVQAAVLGALTSGTSTVTFGFFNSFGTGYVHTITIGGATYSHTQLSGDGSGDIATALAALITADSNATAAASANDVVLTSRMTGGASVACTASDGNGAGTLLEFPGAAPVFELLWPLDVNDPVTAQLLRYVNMPTTWTARAGSGFDTFLCEGLSYCGVNHNLDQAKACMSFPYAVLGWDEAHCRYLQGWYYSGWPWVAEYRAAVATGLPLIKFWALDHLCLYGWALPLPAASVGRAAVRGV
jgi:hypothetical protein